MLPSGDHQNHPPRLDWRQWEEQAVVFNSASGDTHLLNLVEQTALAQLEESGQGLARLVDPDTLAAAVATELEIKADDRLRQYLARVLAQFEELGLVNR